MLKAIEVLNPNFYLVLPLVMYLYLLRITGHGRSV